jgi:beta-galactosidase
MFRSLQVALGVCALAGTLQTAVCAGASPRGRGESSIALTADWRFAKGEQAENVTQLDFDDSAWQAVRLPHDWAIAGPFNPSENGYAGKLPWRGVGWYRKTFRLDEADQGRRVYLTSTA